MCPQPCNQRLEKTADPPVLSRSSTYACRYYDNKQRVVAGSNQKKHPARRTLESLSPLGLEVLDPLVPSRRLAWSSWSPVFTWYRPTVVKETVQEAEDSAEDDDLEAEEILGQSDQSDESKIQNFALDEPGMASDLLNEI